MKTSLNTPMKSKRIVSRISKQQSPRIVLRTVQWTKLQQIEKLPPISEEDFEVLNDLRDVLLRHGYQKRFGVCLLHKHFDIHPGEVALEESDEVSRISTIRVVPEGSCRDAMETAWQFSSERDVKAGRKCTVYCGGPGMTHSRYHECTAT